MGLYLLIIFIIIPIIEIYLFILVGGVIGIVSTLLVVILTAVVGTYLLRIQGLATLEKTQNSLRQGQMPADTLIEGILLLLAGAFLLTPGFFTDAVGFMLLFPLARTFIAQYIMNRVHIATMGHQAYQAEQYEQYDQWHETEFKRTEFYDKKTGTTIIDGEYRREDD